MKKRSFDDSEISSNKDESSAPSLKAPRIKVPDLPSPSPKAVLRRSIHDSYKVNIEEVIGKGKYGRVVVGRDLRSGEERAIKIIHSQSGEDKDDSYAIFREVMILDKVS